LQEHHAEYEVPQPDRLYLFSLAEFGSSFFLLLLLQHQRLFYLKQLLQQQPFFLHRSLVLVT
jgi:hypothetical protein